MQTDATATVTLDDEQLYSIAGTYRRAQDQGSHEWIMATPERFARSQVLLAIETNPGSAVTLPVVHFFDSGRTATYLETTVTARFVVKGDTHILLATGDVVNVTLAHAHIADTVYVAITP